MPNTTNLNLVLTDDDSTKVKDWRESINGTGDSNAKKIDEFAGKFVGGTVNQYYKKKSEAKFDGEWETPDSTPTANSEKLITSGAVHDSITAVDNSKKIIVEDGGAVAQTLTPNVFYVFSGSLTSLTITLGEEITGRESEYKGQFTSGTTIPNVVFPASVLWVGGLSIQANKTYQFSILSGIGVMVGV